MAVFVKSAERLIPDIMKRSSCFVFLSLLVSLVAAPFAAAEKPNIIWIFSDDHSYQTIGAYGGRLKELNVTPNIDRLANEGMRFDRCYVSNSICGPSRAVLLTGKHSHLNGKRDNHGKFNHDQPNFKGPTKEWLPNSDDWQNPSQWSHAGI